MSLLHDVVVLLDLVEVGVVAERRGLEQVARVAPEVRQLGQLLPVALEVAVVDGVEPRQRGEQPDVGLGDRVAHQEATVGEPLLEPVQRRPEPVVGRLVGLLGAGEAAAVDAVVDLGEHPLHDLLHLVAEVGRPQVGGIRAVVVGPLEEEVVGDPREVVGDDLAGRHVDHRGHGDAARVVGVAGVERLLEPLDAQHRVAAAVVEVEGPAVLVVGGPGHAEADHVLEAEQLPDDDRAGRPRAGLRGHQPVAPRLTGQPSRASRVIRSGM